jgi:uncharacterized protein (DUF58 family)
MWWKFLKKKKVEEKSLSKEEFEEIRSSGRAPLSKIGKQVKQVEIITKKNSSDILAGEYRSRFKGQGMQYADSRLYQYGDDIRHIDWRTTARMQDTYVKTFEEERELTILFVVDVSPSVIFGSTGINKRESMAVALACLGFSAISNNDRVGLLFFTDKAERYIPPKKGRKHILRLIDEILTFEPLWKKSNMNEALEFLSSSLKQGSVVILTSDFYSAFEKKKLEILAKKHDFICLRAIDPRDSELPNVGLIRLEDPETGEQIVLPTNSSFVRQEYAKNQMAFRTSQSNLLLKSGVSLIDLVTSEEPARTLHQFFRSRTRRKR